MRIAIVVALIIVVVSTSWRLFFSTPPSGTPTKVVVEKWAPEPADRLILVILDEAEIKESVGTPLSCAKKIARLTKRCSDFAVTLHFEDGRHEKIYVGEKWDEASSPFRGAISVDFSALRARFEIAFGQH
jgi:hypothetical protein